MTAITCISTLERVFMMSSFGATGGLTESARRSGPPHERILPHGSVNPLSANGRMKKLSHCPREERLRMAVVEPVDTGVPNRVLVALLRAGAAVESLQQ